LIAPDAVTTGCAASIEDRTVPAVDTPPYNQTAASPEQPFWNAMSTENFRTVFLPYCLKRQKDGRYVVVNRNSKPLGFLTTEHVDYEKLPLLGRIQKLTPLKAASLSADSSRDLDNIYLYNDSCIPTKSQEHMDAYCARLAKLAKLKVD
jgi:hypothetical protein